MDRVESGLRGRADADEPTIEGKVYFRRNNMNKPVQKITPFLWFDHQAEEGFILPFSKLQELRPLLAMAR